MHVHGGMWQIMSIWLLFILDICLAKVNGRSKNCRQRKKANSAVVDNMIMWKAYLFQISCSHECYGIFNTNLIIKMLMKYLIEF